MPQKPRVKKSKAEGFTLRPVNEESLDPAAADGSADVREDFENLGELPHGYDVDTIFLIAQEPRWLFTYWDIDITRHPGGAAYLRCHLGNGTLEDEIEVPFETRNWYVPVKSAATEYYVEIGFYRGKKWNLIARSVSVTTPPEGMATAETFEYATVPFHLSFQRMLDQLENARKSGEDLLTAMARLQQKGDFSAFGAPNIPDLLSEDQRTLLQALLGPEMLSELASGTQSSGNVESIIRAYLEEQLSSGGASEFLNSFRHATGILRPDNLSSETTASSWEIGALSSWAASAVTSWSGLHTASTSWTHASGTITSWSNATTSWSQAQAAGIRGDTSWASGLGSSWAGVFLASWGAGVTTSWNQAAASSFLLSAGSSEIFAGLSSWLQGTGATSSGIFAELSSWLESGGSSELSSGLSSWLHNLQSSWAEAALSSWNSSGEISSSWFAAEASTSSSWGGASETLSSPGIG